MRVRLNLLAMASLFLLGVVLPTSLWYFPCVLADVRMSTWSVRDGMTASNPHIFSNVRSKLDCAIRIKQFSHCTALTFDPQSATCSLFPIQKGQLVPAQTSDVYWNTNPLKCEEKNISKGSISWKSTLTSFRGEITCYPDFMYTSADRKISCPSNGVREPPIGRCLQYYWRNVGGDLPLRELPRPIFPGWAMCAKGIPTAEIRFIGGTVNSSVSGVIYYGFLLNADGKINTIMTKMDGDETRKTLAKPNPFPFVVGQIFTLSIAVINADHTYSLTINGLPFNTSTSVQSIEEVKKVYLDGSMQAEYINIWCI